MIMFNGIENQHWPHIEQEKVYLQILEHACKDQNLIRAHLALD